MSHQPTARLVVSTFVFLVVAAAASWLAAVAGAGPIVALLIAGVKAFAIAWVFMELASADPVPRVIAVVCVLFVVLLCLGIVADISYRQ
jgi:predicted PurR-regulated permease PerM